MSSTPQDRRSGLWVRLGPRPRPGGLRVYTIHGLPDEYLGLPGQPASPGIRARFAYRGLDAALCRRADVIFVPSRAFAELVAVPAWVSTRQARRGSTRRPRAGTPAPARVAGRDHGPPRARQGCRRLPARGGASRRPRPSASFWDLRPRVRGAAPGGACRRARDRRPNGVPGLRAPGRGVRPNARLRGRAPTSRAARSPCSRRWPRVCRLWRRPSAASPRSPSTGRPSSYGRATTRRSQNAIDRLLRTTSCASAKSDAAAREHVLGSPHAAGSCPRPPLWLRTPAPGRLRDAGPARPVAEDGHIGGAERTLDRARDGATPRGATRWRWPRTTAHSTRCSTGSPVVDSACGAGVAGRSPLARQPRATHDLMRGERSPVLRPGHHP